MSGIAGSLAGGMISDLAGRRTVLMLACLPFLIGLVLLGLAHSLPTIILSRAIQERTNCFLYSCLYPSLWMNGWTTLVWQGFGDGMMFPNLMVYIAEISSKEMRGSLSNAINICQCVGLCLTYSLAILLPWRQTYIQHFILYWQSCNTNTTSVSPECYNLWLSKLDTYFAKSNHLYRCDCVCV